MKALGLNNTKRAILKNISKKVFTVSFLSQNFRISLIIRIEMKIGLSCFWKENKLLSASTNSESFNKTQAI